MNEPLPRSPLEEALEAWEEARNGVIAELEVVPPEQMGFRPAAGSRTAAELIRHVVESGLMMSGELSRRDGDFRRQSYPDHIREYAGNLDPAADRESLRRMLRESHAEGERRIRAAGEELMRGPIRRFDGQIGSRLAWMYHGIAHEYYHRGQLALYVRMMGEVPALTRAIHG